jgi:outer membrane protein OmpA-like peptidoglycan-associated protein
MKMELSSKVTALHERLVIDRAQGLAVVGRVRQAEALLDGWDAANPPSSEMCDVRARICAQSGRYDEAREWWLKARGISGEPAGFATELDALEKYRRWPARAWLRRWSPVWSTIAVVAAIAAVSGYPHRGIKPGESPAGVPDATMAGPDGTHEVRFESGLFTRGATLSDEGKRALEAWARQVKGDASARTIFVLGHTNDLPLRAHAAYTDNYELGLARAQAAVMYLKSVGGLTDSRFTLASAGDVDPPFSNGTDDGRRRNMTVTILISTNDKR